MLEGSGPGPELCGSVDRGKEGRERCLSPHPQSQLEGSGFVFSSPLLHLVEHIEKTDIVLRMFSLGDT